MRLSFFGHAGAGARGVRLLNHISRTQKSPSKTSKSVQGSELVHFFFTVWACMCVGRGGGVVLMIGYRQFPFILLLKHSHS